MSRDHRSCVIECGLDWSAQAKTISRTIPHGITVETLINARLLAGDDPEQIAEEMGCRNAAHIGDMDSVVNDYDAITAVGEALFTALDRIRILEKRLCEYRTLPSGETDGACMKLGHCDCGYCVRNNGIWNRAEQYEANGQPDLYPVSWNYCPRCGWTLGDKGQAYRGYSAPEGRAMLQRIEELEGALKTQEAAA